MWIKNRLLSLEMKFMITLASLTGVLLHIWSENNLDLLFYFTIQSNILVFAYYIANVYYVHTDIVRNGIRGSSEFLSRLKGAVIMAIVFTGLIYNYAFPKLSSSLANAIVHFVVPGFCFLDWLIFEPKHRYQWYDPFLWLAVPVIYSVFTFVRGANQLPLATGEQFPYFFLDHEIVGGWGVFFYVFVLVSLYILVGLVFYFIDNFVSNLFISKEDRAIEGRYEELRREDKP